jgi:hypothetical protein
VAFGVEFDRLRSRGVVLRTRLLRVHLRVAVDEAIDRISNSQADVTPLDPPPSTADWAFVNDILNHVVKELGEGLSDTF